MERRSEIKEIEQEKVTENHDLKLELLAEKEVTAQVRDLLNQMDSEMNK